MQQKNQLGQLIGKDVSHWVPCQRPSEAVIQGKYCILEALEIKKHASQLYDALMFDNQGETWTYLPYGPFANFAEFEQLLKDAFTLDDTIFYAILNSSTRQPLGTSAYMRIVPEHGVIEIGHVHFSKLLKKTLMATEAIYLLLSHIFDKLGYRRCEWKCNSLNEASRQAALRFGFKFEGIFRQHFVYKNLNRDTAWFSIIDSEWPQLKMKFQRWLDATNFDSSGKQILKLSDC